MHHAADRGPWGRIRSAPRRRGLRRPTRRLVLSAQTRARYAELIRFRAFPCRLRSSSVPISGSALSVAEAGVERAGSKDARRTIRTEGLERLATDPTANTSGINSRYDLILGDVEPTKTFLIDTSRNGRGPWTPTGAQASWPDPQAWCNLPERGLGARPSTRSGTPLADAYVWIKVPGESDGQCSRGLGTGNDVTDPVWRQVDPAAGQWFDDQALQLARLSRPPLIGR